MKTSTNTFAKAAVASALAISMSFAGALVADAQVTPTMPVLYNAQGVEVNAMNNNNMPLPAGYYFLAPGGQANTEVYYYGNGTFMDETTGLYGGSVSDPTGTADLPLIYGTAAGTVVPGAPNTGAGGNAFATWMTLAVTGVIATAGAAYLAVDAKRKNSAAF